MIEDVLVPWHIPLQDVASPPLRGIGGAGRVRPGSGGSCRSGEKDKCFAADGGVLAGRTGAGARALEGSRRTRELDHVALKQTIVHVRHERVLDLRNSAWGWRSGGSCRSSAAPRGEDVWFTMATPREGRRRAGEITGSSGVSGAWMIKTRPTPAYAEDRGKIERPRRRIAVVLLGRRDRGTAEGRNLVFSGVRGYDTHRARRWTAEEGRHGHLAKVRVRVDLFHRSGLRHVASHLALRAPSTGRTSNHDDMACSNLF